MESVTACQEQVDLCSWNQPSVSDKGVTQGKVHSTEDFVFQPHL